MKQTALITGATSGIGLEFAKIFAKNSYNLILVARDGEALKKIADELELAFHVSARTIVRDLSKPSSPQEVFNQISSLGIQIDVLINNAGVPLKGKFIENKLEDELKLIQLNIASLTAFCHLFGRQMAKRGFGRILNVASIAAFQPGPFMSNYYACKAYVLMLSEGLHAELKQDGVTVTALCPGPTQTKFYQRPNMQDTMLAHAPNMMTPAKVAGIGFPLLLTPARVAVNQFVARPGRCIN